MSAADTGGLLGIDVAGVFSIDVDVGDVNAEVGNGIDA